MDVDDLELTIRASNALSKAGISTIDQLIQLDWKDLNSIKDAGEKSITQIVWSCVMLLNGRMTARADEWDDRPEVEYHKMSRKIREIKAIINGQ